MGLIDDLDKLSRDLNRAGNGCGCLGCLGILIILGLLLLVLLGLGAAAS